MTISVAIPTYRRPDYLLRTIDEVLSQKHHAVTEIIICDQTPESETSTVFKESIQRLTSSGQINYFRSGLANLPSTRNKILAKAKGDIVLWIDDDVLLPEGFIEQHYNCYIESQLCDEKIIGVAGLAFHRKHSFNNNIDTINQHNFLEFTEPHFMETEAMTHWPNPMVGANHSVLKSMAIENEGFDENMIGPAYYEDADFTCRLRKRFPKYCIYYNPKAHLIHLRAAAGGCRIVEHQKLPAYAITLSTHIFFFRHVSIAQSVIFLWKSIRMGPLRKENVLHPAPFLSASVGFIKSLLLAFKMRSQVKSIFIKNHIDDEN